MNPAASSPSASWLDWGVAVVLAVCIGGTMLALGGYRPETMVLPAWVLAGLVVIRLLARATGSASARKVPMAAVWPLPFLAYAAFNASALSPVPWLGWGDWSGWAIFAAVTWLAVDGLAAPGPRRVVHGSILITALISVCLAVYQRGFDPDWLMMGRTQFIYLLGRASGAFGIPNSQASLLVLLIPAVLGWVLDRSRTARSRVLAGALGAVYLLGLALTISRGAWLALAAALALWPLLLPSRSWRFRLGLAVGALGMSLAFGAAIAAFVPGVKARFVALTADGGESTRPVMWRGAWDLFQESPLTGTGAGSYNVLFERHRPAGFRDDPQWAHNEYLNTLSDYGLIGFGLLVGGFGWAAGRALRAGRWRDRDARALSAGVFAFGLTMAIDFHLKIPALAMILATALAECFRTPAKREDHDGPQPAGRIAAGAAALVVGLVMVQVISPHYRAEGARYGPRRDIDRLAGKDPESDAVRQDVERGLAAFGRAVALNPANAQAWSDHSYALALLAHVRPEETGRLGQQAEASARRALALSSVCPEFWWRLGVALDMQGRWAEAGGAFAQALALAPHNMLAWYHQAFHFSLKPATHALARAAAATCLQLEPGHYPAEALLRTLGSKP